AMLRFNGSSQDTPIDQDNYVYGNGAGVGDVYLYSSAYDIQRDVWSGELQLQGNLTVFGRPANLAVGVDRSDLDYSRSNAAIQLGVANIYDENFSDFPTAEPIPSSTGLTDTQDTGFYGQFQFRPFERLSMLLGGRYDISKSESTYLDSLTDDILSTDEQEDKDFTGRVGLTFDVTDRISVYGLYAQSFEPTSSVDESGNILDPETGETWEAGIKTEWLDGRLGVNAALFRIERDDVAIPDPTNGPGEFDSITAGLQRSDGLELEINGEPLPGWNLSFGGILLDSKFTERDDPFFGSTPGGAADWQIGLFTSYELQDGLLKGFGLGTGLFAIDDRGVSSFVPGAELEGYERVDLSAFYSGFRPVKIALQ
ncbi:MAG: TonB-dependent siderophore receptor, partial [bacterium]